MIALALRTWMRYLVPLAVVSLVALAPLWYLALAMPVPADAAGAKRAIVIAIVVAAGGWCWQLWLVGAAAPLTRAVASGESVAQLRATRMALAGLVRAALPWVCSLAAMFGGMLALVVPGLVASVLFSLAGASTAAGLPAPLVDSAAIVRRHLRATVPILAGSALLVGGLVVASKLALAPRLPKKLDARLLEGYRDAARAVAIGVAIVAPLVATLLAALHTRASEPARERDA